MAGFAMCGASAVLPVRTADAADVFAEGWVEWPADARVEPLVRAGAIVVEGRRRLSEDHVEVRVLLPTGAADALRALGHRVRMERADHRLGPPPEGYLDPEEGSRRLADLASRSDRARLVRLGTSVQGRPIDGLVLGRHPSEAAPEYRVLGGHHGDEWSSVEVALAVAEALVDGDGTDPRATRILDHGTVWVVPYVNPDGVDAGDRHNFNQVDLNRNYDWAWSADERQAGPAPFSEPETRAIRALGRHSRPVAGLSLHSGAVNLGWVWNSTTEPAVEADLFESMAEAYAEACTAPEFWITNGAAWYRTFGDTNDWSYGRYGVPDFTLELTDPKSPPPDQIGAFVAWHLDAILAFLDQPPSLSGRVVTVDGEPVEARLTLDGPWPSAPFYSDPVTGRFHRIAGPGDGALQVVAPGYEPTAVPVDPFAPSSSWVEVVLREASIEQGWATPSVLTEPGRVRLAGSPSGEITLLQVGHDPIAVEAERGRAYLDPAALGAGWWTVIDETGATWPRALWVDEPEGVRVRGWTTTDDGLVVDGRGFGAGTRAWAVVGEDRRLVELPVREEDERRLLLDLRGVPQGERVDVGLWSAGAHIGLGDATNPSSSANPYATEGLRIATGCACRSESGHLFGAVGSLPLVALFTRRRRK